ncbi:MAG: YfjI family protein, partial [Pseudomonadales bacterium]
MNGEPTDEDIGRAPEQVEPCIPFPLRCLPAIVGKFVGAASTAIGCDPAYIALPLLACLARAIGNKRVIRLKRSWTEPAVIWAAIIGKSGTQKTPALQAATGQLLKRQTEAMAAFEGQEKDYEQAVAEYNKEMSVWKKTKTTENAPWEPERPKCERFVASDCTIEALASLLDGQFDGVLVARDELSGWINGIAEYKGGKGSDLGHWLACWSAQPLIVDRKTGDKKTISIERASVSLCGGIQPSVLRTAIGREHLADGLCARLLLAMPPAKVITWTDATIDVETELTLSQVFNNLLEGLEPALDENEEPAPFPLDLSPEAKAVWIEYYNRHRYEMIELEDDLAAAWSKLEAYTARFALIFQMCTWATGDASAGNEIDEASMTSAIALSEWFGGEAKRAYGLFVESEEDRDQRELVNWISRRGGRVTARGLQMSVR